MGSFSLSFHFTKQYCNPGRSGFPKVAQLLIGRAGSRIEISRLVLFVLHSGSSSAKKKQQIFTEDILCANNYSKDFPEIRSFNPHNNHELGSVTVPILQMEKLRIWLSHLPCYITDVRTKINTACIV